MRRRTDFGGPALQPPTRFSPWFGRPFTRLLHFLGSLGLNARSMLLKRLSRTPKWPCSVSRTSFNALLQALVKSNFWQQLPMRFLNSKTSRHRVCKRKQGTQLQCGIVYIPCPCKTRHDFGNQCQMKRRRERYTPDAPAFLQGSRQMNGFFPCRTVRAQ